MLKRSLRLPQILLKNVGDEVDIGEIAADKLRGTIVVVPGPHVRHRFPASDWNCGGLRRQRLVIRDDVGGLGPTEDEGPFGGAMGRSMHRDAPHHHECHTFEAGRGGTLVDEERSPGRCLRPYTRGLGPLMTRALLIAAVLGLSPASAQTVTCVIANGGGFRREVQPRRQHWFLNEKSDLPFRPPAFCSVSRGRRRLGEREYRAPSVTPGVALRPRTQGGYHIWIGPNGYRSWEWENGGRLYGDDSQGNH
jgi:hypothetical protein